jgi:phosphoesterase RecJ-like protein
MSTARAQATRLVQSSKRIWLGTHIRPDGDALGSLLALSLALEKPGRRVSALSADPIPDNYRFLPGSDRLLSQPLSPTPDLGIVVDCDGLSRLGPLEPAFASLPHLIDIDHHHTEKVFGDVHLIDPGAGASGEIVAGLLRALTIPLDPDIATCLYTALLTDTGRFCYGNTTPRTLRVAAQMVAAGAHPQQISRKIYEERSMEATHLLGLALSRLSPSLDGRVVSSVLTQRDFAATGAEPADTEGIIDHLRAIGGPHVALLLVEANHQEVRVSLRSDGKVDVSKIAAGFGGGGHMMAAGCTMPGTAEEACRRILDALRRAFEEAGEDHAA